MSHPLQLGITVLANMLLCALGGYWFTTNGTLSAWLFFAALFIYAFAILTPSVVSHRSRRRCG